MKKTNTRTQIYLDSINYLGDVTDSTLIAEFSSINWAVEFIKEAEEYGKKMNLKVRIIEGDEDITKGYFGEYGKENK